MSWRPYRTVPLAVLAAAFIWWSCGDDQEAPVAPTLDDVTPEFVQTPPAGGGSGAIFTTTPDGGIVNENVRYQNKLFVYLDGGPPPNAPQTSAGLDNGYYVFQITDPPGHTLLSKDPARCRVVRIHNGVIVELVAPTDIPDLGAATDDWKDNGNGNPPCHIADPPDPFDPASPDDAGPSGQHDTNTDKDHGPPAIVVQMMPYGTTPNPGGVYKAWMTPLSAYVKLHPKGIDGLDISPKPIPAGKQKPHACPDDCFWPDPGFGAPRRYVKTDNFKVKERPPMIHVFKYEDVNGDGQYTDPPDVIIPGWPVLICEDTDGDGIFPPTDTDDPDCMERTTPTSVTVAFGFDYEIREVLPIDWFHSALRVGEGGFNSGTDLCSSAACDPQPTSAEVQIPYGGADKYVTFGNWKYSTKKVFKFHDKNANGAFDSEPGLSGWKICVDLDGSGTINTGDLCDHTEDGSGDLALGEALIEDIPPGTYDILEELKTDWTCSFPNPGTPDAVTGVVQSTDCTHSQEFTSGSTPGYDTETGDNVFGNWTTTTKSGVKYEDLAADGTAGTNPPLGGFKIFVDYDGDKQLDAGEPNDVTAADGTYTIEDIVPGTFSVYELDPAGNLLHPATNASSDWVCSFPNSNGTIVPVMSTDCSYAETFISDKPETGNDFYNWEPGEWKGFKCLDLDGDGECESGEPAGAGFTFYVDLDNDGERDAGEPYAITDGTGYATITDIPPGNYNVREDVSGNYVCSGAQPAGGVVNLSCVISVQFFSGRVAGDPDGYFANVAYEGCTPGFWQGGDNADLDKGGSVLWDGLPSSDPDPHWVASQIEGGISPTGSEPYIHSDAFFDFFGGNSECQAADLPESMFFYVDNQGDSSDWCDKTARDVVAAGLNAAWGMAFLYPTVEAVRDAWQSVSSLGELMALHYALDDANNAVNRPAEWPGQACPIDATPYQ